MADVKDINIDQGTTFTRIVPVQILLNPDVPYDAVTNPYIPLDMTGYTAKMEVRSDYDKPVVLTLSTSNGKITLGADGKVVLSFLPADTTAIKFKGASFDGVYDIELTAGVDVVWRIQQGAFIVSREVTA